MTLHYKYTRPVRGTDWLTPRCYGARGAECGPPYQTAVGGQGRPASAHDSLTHIIDHFHKFRKNRLQFASTARRRTHAMSCFVLLFGGTANHWGSGRNTPRQKRGPEPPLPPRKRRSTFMRNYDFCGFVGKLGIIRNLNVKFRVLGGFVG